MTNGNYTSVCWYCGEVYFSNRLTSKFCSGRHRSLYHENGAQVSPFARDSDGNFFNADHLLGQVDYNERKMSPQRWSWFYNFESIVYKFHYKGPLPTGEEILIVGSFAILRHDDPSNDISSYFGVKRFTKLTQEERTKFKIVKAR